MSMYKNCVNRRDERTVAPSNRKERFLLGIGILFLFIWVGASVFDTSSIKAFTKDTEPPAPNLPQSDYGTGLRGDYFENTTELAGDPIFTRVDSVIDFGWNNPPAPGMGDDQNFSVRWTGYVKPPTTGLYRFHTLSDDGVRLWVNGVLLIDNWTGHPATLDTSGPIKLIWGKKYPIKLDYFQGVGGSRAQLLWTVPQRSQQVIQEYFLYPSLSAPPTSPTPTPTPTPTPPAPPTGGTTYVAELRPDGAGTSTGSGTSTLRLSTDERSAVIRFNFANLTTPVNAAHIHGLADPGVNAPILFDFDTAPRAADGSYLWTFVPVGILSVAQIVEGIKTGKTYINVHTTQYPSGEIRGHYRRVNGSSVFTPPAPAPILSLGPTSPQDAARFLTQSSFGVTPLQLRRVQQMRFEAYLNAQFNAPMTSHIAYLNAAAQAGENVYVNATMESFWQKAITGNDQLRQRVALALSEIFVVSNNSSALDIQPYALSGYLDVLQADAFGNFRNLLKDVTLNPAMGLYLNMLGNDKEDRVTGRIPNENYAREVNQLFSVGLFKLHPDGSLILDEAGQPIPTYDQNVIIGFAHIFTGWSWGGIPTTDGNWYYGPSPNDNNHLGWRTPMQAWENHHSQAPKKLLNGVTLPPGQPAERDLNMAIDNIFNHPNVGPFICRQLIQRLVTSNPSPGYVYRVAAVFNDNGAGVRGDMKAVIRAVLLDYEARSPELINQQGYGKQREPVLRFSALLRTFNAKAQTGKFRIWNLESPIDSLGQNPLRAPSVFNFFEPNYVHPGNIAAAGLFSPEFQITNDTQIIGSTNQLSNVVYNGFGYNQDRLALDLTEVSAKAADPDVLVDYLNLLLMSGQISPSMRNIIVTTLREIPPNEADNRAKTAIRLIVTSPQFAVQK